jgi:hypothetical protein
MNTPADAADDTIQEFNTFYNQTHLGEVVARHSFVGATRFELLESDARGIPGPRWLAMYHMGDEAIARAYVQRNGGPPPGKPAYTPGPPIWKQADIAWRVIWRQLALRGDSTELPFAMFSVGMNVPAGTDDAALAEFNTYYTDVHVPEVMAWGNFSSAVRFERYRDFRHPAPGCPQFCAVYFADEAATSTRKARERPRFSSGPPAWEHHETQWRHWYRRLEP